MTRTPPAAVVIDGHSGSGKTSLAAEIAAESGAQVLHLEDLYPGWSCLAAGSSAVATALETGEYRRYDWVDERYAERVRIADGVPLIIEGCGAITQANLDAAAAWVARNLLDGGVHAIWLDCPEDVRRRRALVRDGDAYEPFWRQWAAQERAFFAEHTPWALADEVRYEPGSAQP